MMWLLVLAIAVGVVTGGTFYTALATLAVAGAWCSWRGHRWSLACTDLPGSFRRRCTRCRMTEASPDPHGGRSDWVPW